jgi:dihydrofolate reductase
MMVSLDGFIEGPDKKLDWHVWDEETEAFMYDVLGSVDGILLGRVSYELMKAYWPTANDSIAHQMNYLPKFVFSKTLSSVEWKNSKIINGDLEQEVKALKAQPGKDFILFGGTTINTAFKQHGLIDQYWLFINPVILGNGTPLFKNDERMMFTLWETKEFRCGNVLLKYIDPYIENQLSGNGRGI